MELRELGHCDVKGAGQVKKSKAQSTEAQAEGGLTRMSVDVAVMVAEQRGRVVPVDPCSNFLGRMRA